MTNIREFEPGTQEERGAIAVQRFADPAHQAPQFNWDHDEFWRFGIALRPSEGAPADEVWLRLHGNAVELYGDDDTILSTVATELQQMASSTHPYAVLADGRTVAGLKPADLYSGAPLAVAEKPNASTGGNR
jgi:hypothetical protein